jgi:hypothetical protein
MLVVQLDPEHRSGQHSRDTTFDFDVFFFHELTEITKSGQKRPSAG